MNGYFESGMARCPTCKSVFYRDQPWKRTCTRCYWSWKKTFSIGVPVNPPIDPAMLRRLIQLCHPDRHGGSEAATVATQYLLDLRSKYE